MNTKAMGGILLSLYGILIATVSLFLNMILIAIKNYLYAEFIRDNYRADVEVDKTACLY
jgi:hypothetical protein